MFLPDRYVTLKVQSDSSKATRRPHSTWNMVNRAHTSSLQQAGYNVLFTSIGVLWEGPHLYPNPQLPKYVHSPPFSMPIIYIPLSTTISETSTRPGIPQKSELLFFLFLIYRLESKPVFGPEDSRRGTVIHTGHISVTLSQDGKNH